MRTVIALAVVCGALFALSTARRFAAGAPEATRVGANPEAVIGTWEHFFENAPGHRQVKVINKTHFIWVTYDRGTGMPLSVGGGTYKCDGREYRETFDFGTPGIPQQLVGKEQVMNVNITGNRWLVTGTLTNGLRLREEWHKVRRPVDR